jgi:hypothetical protein
MLELLLRGGRLIDAPARRAAAVTWVFATAGSWGQIEEGAATDGEAGDDGIGCWLTSMSLWCGGTPGIDPGRIRAYYGHI